MCPSPEMVIQSAEYSRVLNIPGFEYFRVRHGSEYV